MDIFDGQAVPEGVIIIMEMIMEIIIIMNALRQTPDTAKLPALPDAGLKKAKVLFVSFFMAQKKLSAVFRSREFSKILFL